MSDPFSETILRKSRGGDADKWGGRNLLSNDPALLNRPTGPSVFGPSSNGQVVSATLIQIADLGRPRQINLQLRFAPVISSTNTTPRLPFSYDVVGGVNKYRVTVRRTVDRQAGPVEEVFELFPQDTLPLDIVLARELTVVVEALTLGSPGQAWVECAAALVSEPGPRNLWHPWDIVQVQRFELTSAIGQRLIVENKDRYQFTVCNTSTDADLLIGFASPTPDKVLPPVPVWPGTNGAFVLPRNMFAVYESPPMTCFKGNVMGVWSNAGNGGALLMEGTVF
jgi:hypothetical protein